MSILKTPSAHLMVARGGSVLVGEDGVVVENSGPADLDAHGLFLSAGMLRARHQQSDQRLQRAIRSTLGAEGLAPIQKVAVERFHGRPLMIVVTQLAERPVPAARLARAALTIVDPDRPIETDLDLLRDMFGLTLGEARVASALAAGLELKTIAASLQITIQSARQYLKSAFAKTGTHRQAELVALLSALHAR